MPIPDTAPRGLWRVDFRVEDKGRPLASAKLLVEDFRPERIAFDLSLPDTPQPAAQPVQAASDARWLFGAPAAGIAARCGEWRTLSLGLALLTAGGVTASALQDAPRDARPAQDPIGDILRATPPSTPVESAPDAKLAAAEQRRRARAQWLGARSVHAAALRHTASVMRHAS